MAGPISNLPSDGQWQFQNGRSHPWQMRPPVILPADLTWRTTISDQTDAALHSHLTLLDIPSPSRMPEPAERLNPQADYEAAGRTIMLPGC